MVASHDIAQFAARLLAGTSDDPGPHYIEGPERYSAADVAAAFAGALGRSVTVATVPQTQWTNALTAAGFSEQAAESMAAMSRITLNEEHELPATPVRGATTLRQYIEALVERRGKPTLPQT